MAGMMMGYVLKWAMAIGVLGGSGGICPGICHCCRTRLQSTIEWDEVNVGM